MRGYGFGTQVRCWALFGLGATSHLNPFNALKQTSPISVLALKKLGDRKQVLGRPNLPEGATTRPTLDASSPVPFSGARNHQSRSMVAGSSRVSIVLFPRAALMLYDGHQLAGGTRKRNSPSRVILAEEFRRAMFVQRHKRGGS